MPRPFPRRLVIDASIARSCGDQDAVFPTSKRCRDCLQAVLDHAHRMVLTDLVAQEWDRHQSNFARRWRVAMQRQGRIIRMQATLDDRLHDRVEATAQTEQQRAAISKDLHLIAAARAADRAVLSGDERIRQLLRRACGDVRELRRIVWANPDNEEEQVIRWLRSGARPEEQRCLGFQEEP